MKETNLLRPLCWRLRRARESKGLSQPQAAARIGCSLRTYQRWEAGTTWPRKTVKELAAALKVAQKELA